MTKQSESYDVVVVGGGPAGMIAAGRAAERGLRVLLLEKNPSLGKKLLLTGGGRCNLTNNEPDVRTFLGKLKGSGKFLFSAFAKWNVTHTLDFFHTHGLETKIENEGRVFPQSDSSRSVLRVLTSYLAQGKVNIRTNSSVTSITTSDGRVTGVRCGRETIPARAVIVATGGTSRPETGSTGDGFTWLRTLGHTVARANPTLVPIALKEAWVRRLAGVTISNVGITIVAEGVRRTRKVGKILFTHVGVSGPTILNMSKEVGEFLKYGTVSLALDLFPSQDIGTLDRTLQALCTTHCNKQLKNALATLVPSSIGTFIAQQANVDENTPCNSVTREERRRIGSVLKYCPLTVDRLLGQDKAIVTSGGVALTEVDFKTMSSRLYPNLHLAGDILNIDRPSGGYSLQLCWTTGFVAGDAVLQT